MEQGGREHWHLRCKMLGCVVVQKGSLSCFINMQNTVFFRMCQLCNLNIYQKKFYQCQKQQSTQSWGHVRNKIASPVKNLGQIVIFMDLKQRNAQERVTRLGCKRLILMADFSNSLTLQFCKLSCSKVPSNFFPLYPSKNAAMPQASALLSQFTSKISVYQVLLLISLALPFIFSVPSRIKNLVFVLIPLLTHHSLIPCHLELPPFLHC